MRPIDGVYQGARVALVVGHNHRRKGARLSAEAAETLGVGDASRTEYTFNNMFALQIQKSLIELGVDCRIFLRRPGVASTDFTGFTPLQAEIMECYGRVDEWGASCAVELHFNSVKPKKGSKLKPANGCETLSSGKPLALALATAVQTQICRYNLKDRGVKTRRDGERGYHSLVSGRAPAILLEPFFASSREDVKRVADIGLDSLAEIVAYGIVEGLNMFPRKTLRGSRTIRATARQRLASAVGVLSGLGTAALSVAQTAVQGDGGLLEKVQALMAWQSVFPVSGLLLGILALTIFVYVRFQAGRVEEARMDDHSRAAMLRSDTFDEIRE